MLILYMIAQPIANQRYLSHNTFTAPLDFLFFHVHCTCTLSTYNTHASHGKAPENEITETLITLIIRQLSAADQDSCGRFVSLCGGDRSCFGGGRCWRGFRW